MTKFCSYKCLEGKVKTDFTSTVNFVPGWTDRANKKTPNIFVYTSCRVQFGVQQQMSIQQTDIRSIADIACVLVMQVSSQFSWTSENNTNSTVLLQGEKPARVQEPAE